jgi:hypothetical protein
VHDCRDHGISEDEFRKLRDLKRERLTNKSDTPHQYHVLLNELEELPSAQDGNAKYQLHFMVQDGEGRIYPEGTVPPLSRSLAQILGLTSTLAKREKENDLGRTALQMHNLLLDPQQQ